MRHHTGTHPSPRPARLPPTAPHSVEAVPWLDLERFLGRWHGVGWLPLPFQRRCAGELTLDYAPRDDGLVTLHGTCCTGDGHTNEARGVVRQPRSLRAPAKLQLRFAPAWLNRLRSAWTEHWVIALDRDYRWVMVGEPRHRYLWILGREAPIDRPLLEHLKASARCMGYDLAPLIGLCHRPD